MRKKLTRNEFRQLTISEPFYTKDFIKGSNLIKLYFMLRGDGAIIISSRKEKETYDNSKVYKFKNKRIGLFSNNRMFKKVKTDNGFKIMSKVISSYYRSPDADEEYEEFLSEFDVKMIRMGRDSLKRRLPKMKRIKDASQRSGWY